MALFCQIGGQLHTHWLRAVFRRRLAVHSPPCVSWKVSIVSHLMRRSNRVAMIQFHLNSLATRAVNVVQMRSSLFTFMLVFPLWNLQCWRIIKHILTHLHVSLKSSLLVCRRNFSLLPANSNDICKTKKYSSAARKLGWQMNLRRPICDVFATLFFGAPAGRK